MAFTIKELESLSGIKAHTIRIWEQRYHFLKPERTSTNIRTYNNEELKTLLTVALLNRYGFKISRIDSMGAEQRSEAVLRLQAPDARLEHRVNGLIGCMVDLDPNGFEALLVDEIRTHGLTHTLTTLVFQFFEKVGILWQAGRILPAQEHVVSHIIRQKVVAAIDALPPAGHAEPLFLLFLPEGEHHEFGLLFIHYLLRRHGLSVLYLGANVPMKDVAYVQEVKAPKYIYLHLTAGLRPGPLQRLVNGLRDLAARDAQVLVSGAVTAQLPQHLPQGITALQSLSEVRSYISRLQWIDAQ